VPFVPVLFVPVLFVPVLFVPVLFVPVLFVLVLFVPVLFVPVPFVPVLFVPVLFVPVLFVPVLFVPVLFVPVLFVPVLFVLVLFVLAGVFRLSVRLPAVAYAEREGQAGGRTVRREISQREVLPAPNFWRGGTPVLGLLGRFTGAGAFLGTLAVSSVAPRCLLARPPAGPFVFLCHEQSSMITGIWPAGHKCGAFWCSVGRSVARQAFLGLQIREAWASIGRRYGRWPASKLAGTGRVAGGRGL
jgi:hypothetical protein